MPVVDGCIHLGQPVEERCAYLQRLKPKACFRLSLLTAKSRLLLVGNEQADLNVSGRWKIEITSQTN